MKKIISLLLVVVMAVSMFAVMSITASAASPVDFTIPNTTVNGAELYNFTNTENYIVALAPGAAIPEKDVQQGPALTAGASTTFTSMQTKNIVATANFGDAPGVFHYVMTQNAGSVDAETYSQAQYEIFVQYGWNNDRTALTVLNVFCYQSKTNEGEDVSYTFGGNQSDKIAPLFTNDIPVNEAVVAKTVTGNMGDLEKLFTFNVKIEYSAGVKSIFGNSTHIAYEIHDSNDHLISSNETTSTDSIQIQLKHGQHAHFSDIPAGSVVTVTENSYAADGYTTSAQDNSGSTTFTSTTAPSGQVAGMSATFANDADGKVANVMYTNTNDQTITGVFTDYTPYMVALCVALLAAVIFVVTRRKVKE